MHIDPAQVYEKLLGLMEQRNASGVRQVTARLLERLDRRTLSLVTGG